MEYVRFNTGAEVERYIRNVSGSTVVIDVETTDLNPRKAILLDVQLGRMTDELVVCFSAEHAYLLNLLDTTTLLVGQNIKYDIHVLHRHGVDLTTHIFHDTMLMHHLVDENSSHGLDHNVTLLWQDSYKADFWAKYKAYLDVPQDERDVYACKDIYYTRKWYKELINEVANQAIPLALIEHVHSLARQLLLTEINGVKIDRPYLQKKGITLQTRIEQMKPELRAMVDLEASTWEMTAWLEEMSKRKTDKGKSRVPKPSFSFESPKQLQYLLYNALSLPPQTNEKTKKISTDYDALEKIKDLHPVVPLVQEYRDITKVYGTYIQGTFERAEGDRIYPEFNVNGTKTGRISHSNPNLGNLPSSGGIRGMFIPDDGHVIISADYGQLEVCLAAHFSQDKALLKIVLEGASQHDITAESLGIERSLAKTLNFAMQYRCSHTKVANLLGVSNKEGQSAWYRYWDTYSGLKRLMDECDKKVDNGEPIITPYGRRRRFPLMKRNPWDKAYRQAFNALIQGTGGDMTSEAFTLTSSDLRMNHMGYGLWTVHDEILISTKDYYADESSGILVKYMLSVGKSFGLTVPLKAECSGPMERWLD